MKYKESFIRAVREYQQTQATDLLQLYSLGAEDLQQNFQSYLSLLSDESAGKNLPKDFVAQTTYWLVDGDEFIGGVTIRHTLTDKLLREGGHIGYNIRPSKRRKGYGKKLLSLALPKTRELEITRVLVTCDETNLGSKKIIEANGGVFENSIGMGKGKPRKLRYWISL